MRFDIKYFLVYWHTYFYFSLQPYIRTIWLKTNNKCVFQTPQPGYPLLQSLRFVYKILLPELKDTVNFLNSYLLRTYPTMFILLDLQEIKAESAAERVYSQSHRVGRWENKPQTCLHKGKGLEYLQDNQSGSRAAWSAGSGDWGKVWWASFCTGGTRLQIPTSLRSPRGCWRPPSLAGWAQTDAADSKSLENSSGQCLV